jgi:hypothetical protein
MMEINGSIVDVLKALTGEASLGFTTFHAKKVFLQNPSCLTTKQKISFITSINT